MKNQEADEDDLKAGIHRPRTTSIYPGLSVLGRPVDRRSLLKGVKIIDNMSDEVHKNSKRKNIWNFETYLHETLFDCKGRRIRQTADLR